MKKEQMPKKKLRFSKKTIITLTNGGFKLKQGGLMPTADTCKTECMQGSCKADPNCVPRTPSFQPDGTCDRRRTF